MLKHYTTKWIKPAIFISSLAFLQACQTPNDPDDLPKLTFDAPLTWEDGTDFSYVVDAEGDEPLTYQLLNSLDANLFELDRASGLLTSNSKIDFSTPQDSDKDDHYELTILVLDEHNRATTADLTIVIERSLEYSLDVVFPPEGANLGGLDDNLHIRGNLSIPESLLSADSDSEISVKIGPSMADVNVETGEWIAEIEVPEGQTDLNIELSINENVVTTLNWSLDNSPIPASYSIATNGVESAYYIALGGYTLLSNDFSSNNIATLAKTTDFSTKAPCVEFTTITLPATESALLVTCSTGKESNDNLFLFDLTSSEIRYITEVLYAPNAGYTQLIDDQYLLFNDRDDLYTLVDLAEGTIAQARVSSDDISAFFSGAFSYFSGVVYVSASDSINDNHLREFTLEDLFSLGDSPANDLFTTLSEEIYLDTAPFRFIDGEPQGIVGYFMDVTDWPESLTPEEGIIFESETRLVMRDFETNNLFSFDAVTQSFTQVPVQMSNLDSGTADISISPDNSTLLAYDLRNHNVYTLSLDDYSVEGEQSFINTQDTSIYTFGQIDVDWQNNILYRHRVLSWAGIEPSEEPFIVSHNLQDGSVSTVLTAADIGAVFGPGEQTYRVGETITTSDPNILWFAMLTIYNSGGGIEGVYSLDLTTKEIKTIHEVERIDVEEIFLNEPFLSNYSPALNGVALTAWDHGYLKTLQADGTVVELIAPRSPFRTSQHSRIDEDGGRIFSLVFLSDADNVQGVYDEPQISLYDMNTGESRILASNDLGNGLNLNWPQLIYDAKRDALYGYGDGLLQIIDPVTGDRVIKSFQ